MTLLFVVILLAVCFEFINGFHDTANAIATSVATKVLTPRQAILLASISNLLGALWGTAVAKTISSGLVDSTFVDSRTIAAALIGAIVWNLITWWYGIPSSSSHALIGGLCGAALASANNNWDAIIWSIPSDTSWIQSKGLLWKVILPMLISPFLGFLIAYLLMGVLFACFKNSKPRLVKKIFANLQILSAASMGFMHGTNDAQKTMGIIVMALVAGNSSGAMHELPNYLSFLRLETNDIPAWIKILCALTMALGTAMGGWKIIKTLGHKLAKLQPIHGFAAETSSSAVIFLASSFGIPVSTTQNISASIMGVGATKSLNSVKWTVVERMFWAWILTLPAAGLVAYLVFQIF